jgi:hypothetical protein
LSKKSERVAKTCASFIKLAPKDTTTFFSLVGDNGLKPKKLFFFFISRKTVSKKVKTP